MTVLLEYFNKFQNEPNLYNWTEYRAKHLELEKLVGGMRKNNLISYTMYDNCIKALTRNYNQAVRLYNSTVKGY